MFKVRSKVKANFIKSFRAFVIISFSMYTFSAFSGIVKADNFNDALKCMVDFSKIQNSIIPAGDPSIVLEHLVKFVVDGILKSNHSAKILMVGKNKLFNEHFSQKDFRFLLVNSVWSAFLAGKGHLLNCLEEVVDVTSIKDSPSNSYRLEILIGIGGLHLLKILEKHDCCNKLYSIEMLALNMPDIKDNQISFENIKTILVDLAANLEKLLK